MRNSHSRPRVLAFMSTSEARLLIDSLLNANFEVVHANPAHTAMENLRAHEPNLVLMDLEQPEISGLELVCRIRKDPLYADLAIVGLGTETENAARNVAIVAGCTGFIGYPLAPATFAAHLADYLSGAREELDLTEHLQYYRLFSEVLIEKLEARLDTLERRTVALESEKERQKNLTLQILTSMAKMIETKDPYTRGHSVRVTSYAMALGRKVGLKGEELKTLERASQLHDLGKIIVDLKQIHKPGPLSEEEWELIRQHPATGYRILSPIDFLQDEALIVKHHHRRFETFGEHWEIPRRIRLMASILTLADSYDAMTSQRSYNQLKTKEKALQEIRDCSGTQFDPDLVEAFEAIRDEVEPFEAPGEGSLPDSKALRQVDNKFP